MRYEAIISVILLVVLFTGICSALADGFDFKTYPNANKTGTYDYIYSEYIRSTEYIGKIELLEGQILEIDANVILTVYTGINFF